MGLIITYTGWRPYAEVKAGDKRYGFARGQSRDDIPEDWIRAKILPALENGSTLWKVEGLGDEEKTEAMKTVIDEPAVVEEEPTEEAVEATVDYSSLTRAKLMAECKALGLPVDKSDKKADLLGRIEAHLA